MLVYHFGHWLFLTPLIKGFFLSTLPPYLPCLFQHFITGICACHFKVVFKQHNGVHSNRNKDALVHYFMQQVKITMYPWTSQCTWTNIYGPSKSDNLIASYWSLVMDVFTKITKNMLSKNSNSFSFRYPLHNYKVLDKVTVSSEINFHFSSSIWLPAMLLAHYFYNPSKSLKGFVVYNLSHSSSNTHTNRK